MNRGDSPLRQPVQCGRRQPSDWGLKSNLMCFKALVGLRDKPYLIRAFTLLRHRVFKNGLIRNLGTLAIV